jgi:signal transduction histidine kinase
MIAFAIVVVAFVTATVYSESRTSVINDAAISIATNAAPSIERLAASRSGLRQLLLAEDEYADTILAGGSASPAGLLAARAVLDDDLRAYRALPRYPGEAEAWNTASHELGLLDRTLADVVGAASQGPAAMRVADTRFRGQIAAVSKALTDSLQINADVAERLAQTIQKVSVRRRRLAFGLDVVCAAATLGAALLVLRLLRRHQRLARAYEQTLERRADEMEAFAGRVAHDVRNALAPVSLSVSHLNTMNLGDQPHQWVSKADRGLWRVFDLVEGLLAFAQAGARPVRGETADVPAVVQDVVSSMHGSAEEARCELSVRSVVPCRVPCNVGVLTSLVGNLVGNAIKHIGDGQVRRVEVSAIEHGPMVRVSVGDTGPGVPAHLRDTIFQPFVKGRRDTAGAGLGLATVRRLAEGHGGRAGMDPAPGGGSVFWFELPWIPAEEPRAKPAVPEGASSTLQHRGGETTAGGRS